jgi:hypothetical protein
MPFPAFFVALVFWFTVGAVSGAIGARAEMEREAVEVGAARFNPQTRVFEWITPEGLTGGRTGEY